MKFFDKSEGVKPEEYMAKHETHCFGYGYPSRKYANCVKLYSLGLTDEQIETAFKVIGQDLFWDEVNSMCADFDVRRHRVYFGGRSDGWIYLDDDVDDVNYEDLVDFDKLCDQIRETLIWYCESAKFKTITEMIPRTKEIMILPGDEEEDFDDVGICA